MEDMRSPEFPKFTLPLFEDIKKVFKIKDGGVFIYPSSGTGRLGSGHPEHAEPRRQGADEPLRPVLALWVDMAQRLGLDVVLSTWSGARACRSRSTGHPRQGQEPRDQGRLRPQNETATGVTSDIAGVRKAMDAAKHPALLMVDGVTSIGSIDFRMDEWGVDCAVSGSQKGFMLPAGLGILAVSQKALER